MVFLLINPAPHAECNQCVAGGKEVEPHRWNNPFNYDFSEITNIQINRVQQEKIAPYLRERIDAIENSRHIHKQKRKNAIQILNIPEKHVKRRQDQPDAEIEKDQTAYRIQQQNEFPCHRNSIDNYKQEINYKRNAKVDQ